MIILLRNIKARFFSCMVLLATCHLSEGQRMATERPNVLFIVADDLNNHMGTYGHPLVSTPNLDRLAKAGVRFDNAYCQYPLCSPSRVSMLTGLRPDSTNVFDLKTDFRDRFPHLVTLPEFFKSNGYFSARVGKIFHYGVPGDIGTNGLDDARSWDVVVNPRGRDKDEEHLLKNLTPNRGLGSALAWLAADGTDDEQTDGMVAANAIRLMRENKDKPFFIAAGFFRPHCPFIAPRKYFDPYSPEHIFLPEEPLEHFQNIPKPALWTDPLYWGLGISERKEVIRAYYASITFMDAQVGKLLSALDSLGLSKNTIVVFLSDHGYLLTEHGQWMKMSLFEASARVPLIIAAPGQKGNGRASSRIVELLDLYPTLTKLCGLASPAHVQGRNIAPLLENPDLRWHAAAYTQVVGYPGRFMARSVRTGRWRYTEWGENGVHGTELYDYKNDPQEYRNLANKRSVRKIQARLKALLKPDVRDPIRNID